MTDISQSEQDLLLEVSELRQKLDVSNKIIVALTAEGASLCVACQELLNDLIKGMGNNKEEALSNPVNITSRLAKLVDYMTDIDVAVGSALIHAPIHKDMGVANAFRKARDDESIEEVLARYGLAGINESYFEYTRNAVTWIRERWDQSVKYDPEMKVNDRGTYADRVIANRMHLITQLIATKAESGDTVGVAMIDATNREDDKVH